MTEPTIHSIWRNSNGVGYEITDKVLTANGEIYEVSHLGTDSTYYLSSEAINEVLTPITEN